MGASHFVLTTEEFAKPHALTFDYVLSTVDDARCLSFWSSTRRISHNAQSEWQISSSWSIRCYFTRTQVSKFHFMSFCDSLRIKKQQNIDTISSLELKHSLLMEHPSPLLTLDQKRKPLNYKNSLLKKESKLGKQLCQ